MVDLHAELLALIRAVREETPHEGPWRCAFEEHGETRRGWWLHPWAAPIEPLEKQPPQLWLDADEFTEAQANSICDALNGGQSRFEAELARRWAASIIASAASGDPDDSQIVQAHKDGLAAAREASHED